MAYTKKIIIHKTTDRSNHVTEIIKDSSTVMIERSSAYGMLLRLAEQAPDKVVHRHYKIKEISLWTGDLLINVDSKAVIMPRDIKEKY